MSRHLKRYAAPAAWHIARKDRVYVTKTAPGPHNANAMPVAVWLRDHMGLARTMKEVKQILAAGDVVVNGRACRDPKMGLGVFDIVSVPKTGKHYRILLDKKGRTTSVEIPAENAKTRLAKIRDKRIVAGGKVQLNFQFGANVLADNTYHPKDSVVITLADEEGRKRFSIVDHFPYAVGNMAMVIGGRHSGKVGRIVEIIPMAGTTPNRVILEEEPGKARFDTVEHYIFMVGREQPAVKSWGIEA